MADTPKDYTLNGYDQFLTLDNLSSDLSRSILNDFSNGINNANSDALIGSGAVGFSQTTMNNLMTNQDMQSDNFVTGSSGWRIQGNGNVEFGSGYFRGDLTGATGTFSGTITGGSLNIPDTTTANSFHVESDGDTFWGTTPALFTSDNNNATSYILKTGAARFSSITITGLQSGSSLDGQYLQSLSVQTGSIANLAITAGKIDNATITAAQIANATITGTQIASATITASNITNATITGTQIASATITGSNIAATTITASNIANATITATQIASATILAGNIVSGTITATQIASATILAGNIANGTITTSQISATAGIVGGQIASATITGGNIASTTITAGNITNLTITASQIANLTITSGKVQTGLMSYSHNIAFSVSSSTVVAWASGTITTSDGTSYSISSGNTGTMAARSYIYLDNAVSSTVLQVTTTFSTAVGDTKMLVATAENNTTEAVFEVFNGIGGTNLAGSNIVAGSITANEIAANTITASLIAAGTITASQIAAGTITADKMNITDLSAISANIGTITAGSLAGVTMSIGSSNSIFKADANGIYLGHATFGSAPFRVNMAGALVSTSATITGAITASSGSITGGFSVLAGLTVGSGGSLSSGQSAYDTGTGFWLDYNAGTPRFSLGNSAGNKLTWNGTTLAITGSIATTSATIGAWTVNATSIYTGTEDHSGYTANAGDLTLYSDGSDASIHANKFYIDSAGVLNCTAAIVAGAVTTTSGSSVDGTYLVPYTVTSGKASLALVGWTQTCAFTVTDADTVAWGSGTLTLSDGTAYSISAGNTGNMAAKTYIYLDVGVSTTVYQATTTAATAIGDDKILLAIAQNGTGEATFMLLNNNSYNIDAANIVAGSITANEIAASTITANKIAANTITANELTTGAFVTTTANITDAIITNAKISDLSVAKLTAGTISSKAITLAITAGTGDTYIAAGKTDFDNTQSGFILGLDDSDSDRAKFYIGNSTEYLNWDGVNLTVTGTSLINAPATKTFTAGEALTANDAVIIAPTATETYQITQTTTDNTRRIDVTTDKVGQTFTTRKYDTQKILSFIFSMSKTGSPGNITFDLHATSGGLPTGAALSSVTLTSASFSGSLADITIDFSPDVSLSSNTMYAVVFYGVSLTGANYYSFADNFASVYADGTAVWYNGSVWQTTNGRGGTEEYFKVNMSEVPTTTGSVYKAEADSPYTYYYNNFIGFAQTTVAAAGTARIISSGIMGGFTGLTPGAIYYLSNTAGAISSSAGTNSVKIGRAVSTTELLIVIPPL